MSALAAEGVSFAYGREQVLDGVDLTARPGRVTAVVGPNGSGKTTLLRLLAGLLKPSAGQVLSGSRPLAELSRRRLAREIAFAPQLERPAWPLSVAEMVALGRVAHRGWLLPFSRRDREAVDQALAATELEGLADRLVTELSGGEFKRVVFARTLAQEAAAVLLDEPTAHLDLRYQVSLLERLRELTRERGLTAVVTLHDLNQAAAYADRVALLHEGRVLAAGTPAEALTPESLSLAYGVEVGVFTDPGSGRYWVAPVGALTALGGSANLSSAGGEAGR